MEKVKSRPKQRKRCAGCRKTVPNYDMVSVGSQESGYRDLCNRCCNLELAELEGLEGFEHFAFEPVQVAACTGATHEFHFRTRLFGLGVALDAFELRDGHPAGYQFQIIGRPQDDPLALLGLLIAKIRRALSIQSIETGELGPQIADHRTVRANIEWDASRDGAAPLLGIDGREVTWEEFGRMLTSFEGWQFKLEIKDKSEEF